ncbi:PepSY domain-containing protein [Pigmentiphaga aceris]|uniref:PepSY domain-containing protein n=1 Tax=Pigmentiphaga aceris TaxID=1940612 RepID=A0A5C0ASS8_9BURK|nr:PepSY domain-containing protein [Pigmentiphaga aceris]QEI04706.1 PepSY domain-containing protein [Pigmentiphaga aceris]
MSSPSLADARVGARPRTRSIDVYRAVWRWHFYAGLLVLPFLLLLAITGAIYLFHHEIDAYVYRDLRTVPASTNLSTSTIQAPSAIADAALKSHPGTVFRYVPPASATASAQVGIRDAAGKHVVYVNPYTGQVLGSMIDRGGIVWLVRELHGLSYFGPIANGMIEVAGGWTILLVLTGIYLWWPRGQKGGVVSVRGAPRQRVFWRDVHAVTGLFAAFFILFLAITGMPWSLVWGAKVNQWANGNNFGYPSGVRVNVPMSRERLADSQQTTWSLEQARMPMSTTDHTGAGSAGPHAAHDASHAGMTAHAGHTAAGAGAATTVATANAADDEHAGHGGGASPSTTAPPASAIPAGPAQAPIGLDAAVAAFTKLGMAPGYAIAMPASRTGVYTGSAYPNDLSKQRVVHLDQYRGTPLIDMSYADYGPLGKSLEWGINVHMGQEFGLANQLLMLVVCLAIVLLCVSGASMWWKRRPSGAVGVPPMPANPKVLRTVVLLLAIGGVIFPLVGASLLVMLAIDLMWARRQRASTDLPA